MQKFSLEIPHNSAKESVSARKTYIRNGTQ